MEGFVAIILSLFAFAFLFSQLLSIYLKLKGRIVVKIGKKKPFPNSRDLEKFVDFGNTLIQQGNIILDDEKNLIAVSHKAENYGKEYKKSFLKSKIFKKEKED